jgi:hypothetical protein
VTEGTWVHDPDALTPELDAEALAEAWEEFGLEDTPASRDAFSGGFSLALQHVRRMLADVTIDGHAEAERTPNDFLRGYAMGASMAAAQARVRAEFWASPQRDANVAARAAQLDAEEREDGA